MRNLDCRASAGGAATKDASAIRVLFFGRVADALGREVEVATPVGGCSLAELRERLGALGEAARAALARCDVRAAVDQVIADDSCWVSPRQEVAFFSMFSGG
jgi:molybdopterin synthase sulfur carrier subunit